MFRAAEEQAARYEDGEREAPPPPGAGTVVVGPIESAEAGVQRAGRILAAATTARWPMYLRNVKQILRQAEGGFDERRYGFGGLMDLLKACQREGLVRIERDRRGGLRVFQGAAIQKGQPAPIEPSGILDVEPIEMQPGILDADEPGEMELPGSEPIPIDTTAELLGRAKHRKPRVRAPRQPAASATPKVASARPSPGRRAAAPRTVKKAAAPRRATRGKKAAASEAKDDTEG
jgi:hypothetical protein